MQYTYICKYTILYHFFCNENGEMCCYENNATMQTIKDNTIIINNL